MEGEHFFEEYTEVQKLASVLRGQYCTLTCFESVNTIIVCSVLSVVWYVATYVCMYVVCSILHMGTVYMYIRRYTYICTYSTKL